MARVSTQSQSYVELCQRSSVGKRLPDALYVHRSALGYLDAALQELEQLARKVTAQVEKATIIKFSFNKPQIVYLFYPDFETEAHPALQSSIQVNLNSLKASERDYSTTDNPPVLHRKETFIAVDNPLYPTFAWLTKQEEVLGLLDDSRGIGFRNAWEQRLASQQIGNPQSCLGLSHCWVRSRFETCPDDSAP